MREASDAHVRESMKTNRDLWVSAAEFDSLRVGDWGGRLSLIMSARDVGGADSLARWRYVVDETHGAFVPDAEKDVPNNHDKLAQSFYFRAAILQLLELVDAPYAFKVEVEQWTRNKLPKSATKRGALQAALIDHPHLADDPAALAEKAKCDRRLVDRYLGDGSVQPVP